VNVNSVQIAFSIAAALSRALRPTESLSMLTGLIRFAKDNAGVTPVEYGLIAAILAVVMTVAVSAAGYSLADFVG
jgi:pilus assembly protein Flp/PilA